MIFFKFNSWFEKMLVFIILMLYLCFLYIDFFNIRSFMSVDYIKFTCTLLCFCLSFSYSADDKNSFLLLHIALLFTLISDFIILILDNNSLGVTTFCITHILYSIRHDYNNYKKTLIYFLSVFLTIALLFLIGIGLRKNVDYLTFISLFYFLCLLTNVFKSLKAYREDLFSNPKKIFIAAGVILFFLCDINVGLYNITGFSQLNTYTLRALHRIGYILMWFFYLPSQLLLASSEKETPHSTN